MTRSPRAQGGPTSLSTTASASLNLLSVTLPACACVGRAWGCATSVCAGAPRSETHRLL
jgi:hypothetical protein